MDVKVIGSGCENCDKTNAVVKECLEELGIDTEIERVTDLVEIVIQKRKKNKLQLQQSKSGCSCSIEKGEMNHE